MEFESNLTKTAEVVNPVLRDTFRLLAIMFAITTASGYIAYASGLFEVIGIIGFYAALIAQFVLIFVIQKAARKPGSGSLGWMAMFAVLEGFILQLIISNVAAVDPGAIGAALATTALVFLAMTYIAQTTRRDLSAMGSYLLVALIALIVAMIVNIFVASSLMGTLISVAASVVFSLFILYDVNRIVKGGETNYVSAALGLFISITGLFIHLLNLFSSRD